MSLKAGIVGLPNVGKSTLFNAITKKNILAANYPFATIDPNVGIVTVPDSRLEFLENLYMPKSVVPTTFEFTDIAVQPDRLSQIEFHTDFIQGVEHFMGTRFIAEVFDHGVLQHVVVFPELSPDSHINLL